MSVTNYVFSGGQNGGQSPHFGSISKSVVGSHYCPLHYFSNYGVNMGKLTAKQVIAYSKAEPKKYSDGEGLYFCVRKQGSPYWMIRYTTAKGRREATLGQFPLMSLADARIAAAYFRKEVRDGIDPLLEKQKIELPDIETVDQLFHDWYRTDLSRRLKHPKIPYRVYTKDISPVIGIKCIAEVTARDVREVLERIRESNRPTIANDTLMYMKQLFRHAIKLDLTLNNPAAAFTVDDAGGVESSKDRMLSKEEIHYAFSVFHTHINSFGRDNYLACCLFLVLGVRKSELCEAMWREMDLTTGVWDLPKERSKTGVPISIPFPITMLAGLGWCIGIALLEQPYGIGSALTRYCLMVLVVLAPWLTLKLTFYVIVGLGRKLGLIPPARLTYSLGYEGSPLSF